MTVEKQIARMLYRMSPENCDKLKTLSEAVSLIKDGDSVTFSGVGISAHPVAFAHEMIRQQKRNLEIAGSAAWFVDNLLIGAGSVDRMLVIADSSEVGGVSPALRRAVQKGDLIVEDYSFFALACRLMAGAIGVPFLPTKSMLGSDMLRHTWLEGRNKFRIMKCPFSGEKVVLVPALKPDVAVIHAQRADEDGNVQMLGPTALVEEQARASNKVIVTVEKIVSKAVTRRRPELTIIPSFVVDAIVEVPYGAHPTSVHTCYDYDLDHLKYAFEQSKDEENFKRYLDEFVHGTNNHLEYLKRVGGPERLKRLETNLQFGRR